MTADWTDPASGQGATSAGTFSRRAAARRTLEDCWAPLHETLEASLPEILLEALGPVVRTADEAEAKRAKFALMRDRVFVHSYVEALRAEFSAAIAEFVEHRAGGGVERGSLALVDVEAVEQSTLVEQSAARLRNSVDEPFTAIKLRLANLVRELEVRDVESPFRVTIFVRALATALRAIGVGDADFAGWIRLFPPVMARPAAAAYHAIDAHLNRLGVSAELASRPATFGPGTRFVPTRAPTEAGTVDEAVTPTAGGLAAAQMLNSLYLRMRLAPPAGEGGAVSDTGQAVRARPADALELAPGASWNADSNLLQAIGEFQRLGALAMSSVIQGRAAPDAQVDIAQLREQLAESASRKVDKLTIELVGMVFDRINGDRHVPEQIKELLTRLQFPLLKVALTDPDLFVGSDQSARKLLDRIASTSIGWSPEGEDNQRYLAQVRAVVHDVLSSVGEASNAFDRAYVQFELFLEAERTRDDDPVARARRALAEAETREIRAIKTTMQVRSAFDGVQLESYLRDFLLYVWVRVLIEASDREKTQPGLVRKFLDAVPEIVWSVQPKINQSDRKRMIGTIPTVLAVLREGLQTIDWPQRKVQQFFGRLMASHANAVKALEIAHGAPAPFVPSTLRIKLDGFKVVAEAGELPKSAITISDDAVRHILQESGAEVTHLSLPEDGELPAPAIDHGQAQRAVASWQCGMWFDLRVGGRLERVKLAWISPRETLYLFTTQHGRRAHSLSPENIVAYVQAGWLAPVEQAALFSRAVEGVMYDLKHAGEPAAG